MLDVKYLLEMNSGDGWNKYLKYEDQERAISEMNMLLDFFSLKGDSGRYQLRLSKVETVVNNTLIWEGNSLERCEW